jgi:hypothetical protein
MLAHVWTARALNAGVPGWGAWLRSLERHEALPRRIDPLHLARTRTGRAAPEQVHVVLDHEALAPLVGIRRLPPRRAELAAEAPDLARRVGAVVGLLAPADHRRALMRQTMRPWLAQHAGTPLAVPLEHPAWLQDHADRIAEGVRRAGYAVHGDLADLAPVRRPGVEAPDPRDTLDLAIRMLLTDARQEEEPA